MQLVHYAHVFATHTFMLQTPALTLYSTDTYQSVVRPDTYAYFSITDAEGHRQPNETIRTGRALF